MEMAEFWFCQRFIAPAWLGAVRCMRLRGFGKFIPQWGTNWAYSQLARYYRTLCAGGQMQMSVIVRGPARSC